MTNMKMTKAGQKKVGKVMGEYKEGTLHSGKGGKVVLYYVKSCSFGNYWKYFFWSIIERTEVSRSSQKSNG